MSEPRGAYDGESHIADYILGITFEIWEERRVELVHQYYSPDCVVYALDGITRGAQQVVEGTLGTLQSFPGRLLIGENVIWSGGREEGYYSSHRLLSLLMNEGPTLFGPRTGRPARMTNIADCIVENGVITGEWLIRDNLALVEQLGFGVEESARKLSEQRTAEWIDWFHQEHARVMGADHRPDAGTQVEPRSDPRSFAERAISAVWRGDEAEVARCYAPYAVLHRSPVRYVSGQPAICDYFGALGRVFDGLGVCVDHVVAQPFDDNGVNIAARWSVAGTQRRPLHGSRALGQPLYILGVTHLRCVAGRIVREATIFDELALLSQSLRPC